jgi:hypothetical protein
MCAMSSVRLRGWVGSLAVGSVAAVGFLPGPATATPLRPRPPVIAEIAQKLAAVIRHDARERGASAATEVTVTRRCCGRRLLAVYHRAASDRFGGVGQFGVSGGYELQLETVGQSIRQVTVSSLATEKSGYRLGEQAELVRPYTFSISHFTSGRSGWSSEIGFDRGTLGWGLRLPRGTKERAPALAASRLAMSVIRNAQMHARVVDMAAPWPIEGLRHAGDHYTGQTEPVSFLWEGMRYQGHAEPIEIAISANGESASVSFPMGLHEPLLHCVRNDPPVYNAPTSTKRPVRISQDGTFTAQVGEKPDYPVQIVRGRFAEGEVSGTIQTLAEGECGGTTTFSAIVDGTGGQGAGN